LPSLGSISTILIRLRIGCNYKTCAKKKLESFKEYAQRWRDLEAQVAPPITEKEIITMIVDTLLVFYYEKMVGYTPSNFADLVFTSERIKVGLRRGKFDYPALMNEKAGANGENEMEGGTHAMIVVPTWPNFPPAQQCHYSANINLSHYPLPNQPQGPPVAHPMPAPPLKQTETPTREGAFQRKSLYNSPQF